ncbi:N5,N10-methylene tetrahydromethanopterin reductase [Reticulibacter mediterranei]|uniref:N5,N10-methylene tetrahydromethanopterin reductase n=1 Tax=Reticulibacter mediterranei TaxID=2778369 RepID=A0A8J3N7H8_9CHLR|nr:LLM class flavin-dependent oxidoreductase [Reticulibacter mediterranei]GHO97172.1 N5,N10-methylene tetrahydromethanopterin reductase [Reticulibacter mediterranei]
MTIPLSVLDLSLVDAGLTSTQALQNTIALARQAERLGYTRYWLAEHHNTSMLASSAPEIMIGHVAQATNRLRVGSGGVMLPNHSPLKVAETFRVLEALHPGRIDLGIGRAPGTDPMTALALRRSKVALGADDFPEQLAELFAYTSEGFEDDHPFRSVSATPTDIALPPVWLLGSSDYSAQVAAALGLGFAFAHHINPQGAERATHLYQENFKPSRDLERPKTIVATSVVCADTEELVEELVASMALAWVRMRSGHSTPIPSPQEALDHIYTPAERALAQSVRSQRIIGTPDKVKILLDQLIEQTEADELMITTFMYGHNHRLRALELLADLFALQPAVEQS